MSGSGSRTWLLSGAISAVALIGPLAGVARAQTSISDCSTAAVQQAFAAGGSYEFDCSGTIATPGAPFSLGAGVSLTLTVQSGQSVTLDGGGANTVIDDAGNLTINGLTIANGNSTGQDGQDGQDGAKGTDGEKGPAGLDGPSGSPGGPGQTGASGSSGTNGTPGLGGFGGGMIVEPGAGANLTNVIFSGDQAKGGSGGGGGDGGDGGDGGAANNGGRATSKTGNGGNGGMNGGSGALGAGGPGGDGGSGAPGGSAQGGAIFNAGTLTLVGCDFFNDTATGGDGGKGGDGGDGGKGGPGGQGGEDMGKGQDGNGGDGAPGGDAGGSGNASYGGTGAGGAIYNNGSLTIDSSTSFSSDSATGGKGGDAGANGSGGDGGTGGNDADNGTADKDGEGTGGNGGDGGNAGGGSSLSGNGGEGLGGAIYSVSPYTVVSPPLSFFGDTVTGGDPGAPADYSSKGGKKGSGGAGGTSASGGSGRTGSDGSDNTSTSAGTTGITAFTDTTPSNGISAPTCTDLTGTVQAGQSMTFQLQCSTGGASGSYLISSPPKHGLLGAVDEQTGAVTYTADPNLTATTSDTFTYIAEDSDGIPSAPATVTVTITPPAVLNVTDNGPQISTSNLPDGTEGTPYAAQLAVTGGTPPYHLAVSSGTLPTGLSMSDQGLISGTPTQDGTFYLSAEVTDTSVPAQRSTRTFTLGIAKNVVVTPTPPPSNPSPPTGPCPPLSIATQTLPAATVGVPYSVTIPTSGGQPPIVLRSLQPSYDLGGLTISGGQVSGTPDATGTFQITLVADDDCGQTVQSSPAQSISLSVHARVLSPFSPRLAPQLPHQGQKLYGGVEKSNLSRELKEPISQAEADVHFWESMEQVVKFATVGVRAYEFYKKFKDAKKALEKKAIKETIRVLRRLGLKFKVLVYAERFAEGSFNLWLDKVIEDALEKNHVPIPHGDITALVSAIETVVEDGEVPATLEVMRNIALPRIEAWVKQNLAKAEAAAAAEKATAKNIRVDPPQQDYTQVAVALPDPIDELSPVAVRGPCAAKPIMFCPPLVQAADAQGDVSDQIATTAGLLISSQDRYGAALKANDRSDMALQRAAAWVYEWQLASELQADGAASRTLGRLLSGHRVTGRIASALAARPSNLKALRSDASQLRLADFEQLASSLIMSVAPAQEPQVLADLEGAAAASPAGLAASLRRVAADAIGGGPAGAFLAAAANQLAGER